MFPNDKAFPSYPQLLTREATTEIYTLFFRGQLQTQIFKGLIPSLMGFFLHDHGRKLTHDSHKTLQHVIYKLVFTNCNLTTSYLLGVFNSMRTQLVQFFLDFFYLFYKGKKNEDVTPFH